MRPDDRVLAVHVPVARRRAAARRATRSPDSPQRGSGPVVQGMVPGSRRRA